MKIAEIEQKQKAQEKSLKVIDIMEYRTKLKWNSR